MKRRIVTLFVAVCMITSIVSYSVLAYANSTPFSCNAAIHKASVTNSTGSSKLLTTKATLSAGTGGVWVQVRNSSGTTIVKQKLFPYHDQSVDPLTVSVGSGVTRRLYVKPNTSGQTVTGTLYWDF